MKPWASTSAFLIRSLRQESRFAAHHVLRASLAFVILLLFLARVATFSLSAGAGGEFARTALYCCYAIVTLLGGVYFSAAIVEEKEEQTLPLLRLTGASPLAILVGKSGPRLASVLLLLLVIVPFLMLSITLGGVVLRGLLTALLGLLIYSIMFCQLGLFASVVGRDFQNALGLTIVLWLFLEFLPVWGWLGSTATIYLSSHGSTTGAQRFVDTTSLFSSDWWEFLLAWLHLKMRWLTGATEELGLYRNMSLYLVDFGGDPVWRPQMTAHLIVAAAFLFFSWLLFEPMTAKVMAEGFHTRNRLLRRTRSPRRVHGDALAWKSWRWLSGGWLWFFVRLVAVPLGVWGTAEAIAWRIGVPLPATVLTGVFLAVGVPVFIGHFAILLERLFHPEIQQQTLSALLLLPLSRNALCARLTVGLLPAMVTSLSCAICGLAMWFTIEPRAWQMTKTGLTSPWFYEVILILFTTLYFGLFLSVRLRHGGMLVAIFSLWVAAPLIISSVFGVLSFLAGPRLIGDFIRTDLPYVLISVQVPFCVWMHRLLLRSLDNAGAQS